MFDWDTPWENVREETISTEGESDQFVLAIGTSEFTALGFANEAPPEELIGTAIDVHSRNDGFEVATETPIGDVEISMVETVTTVPSATLTYEAVPFGESDAAPMATYMEVHPVIASGSIDNPFRLLVTLDAPVDADEDDTRDAGADGYTIPTYGIVTQDEYERQVEPFQELHAGLSVPGPASADDAEED